MMFGDPMFWLTALPDSCRKSGLKCPSGVDGRDAMKADAAAAAIAAGREIPAYALPLPMNIDFEGRPAAPPPGTIPTVVSVTGKKSLPDWLLPVGIGAGVLLVAGVVLSSRRRAPAMAGYRRRRRSRR